MPTVRIRLTGTDDDARTLINAIHALYGVEHIEEIDDIVPSVDDSRSVGLSEETSAGQHDIEVAAPRQRTARHVRNIADLVGEDLGVPIEIVDDF
jgi:hypothetical protein